MHFDEQSIMALLDRDPWIDEIQIRGELGPLLRLKIAYRYKTSGLSGDEWRTSASWQCTPEMASQMQGDLAATSTSGPGWFLFDGPYGTLDAGAAALFPGLFGNQPAVHMVLTTDIDFLRKGRLLYRSTRDALPTPLLTLAGHLPWALVLANDEPLGTAEAWEDMRGLCFQSGCAEPAVSTYALKSCYDPDGRKRAATQRNYNKKTHSWQRLRLIRRFCPLHLRRGDCGLEDADSNYIVLDGPGPAQAMGWEAYRREASRVYL